MKYSTGLVATLAYVLTIPAANWALGNLGTPTPNGPHVIPVGFGLAAPSGVLFAGLALWLRDMVQDALGKRWVLGAIVAGAALSWWISPVFALASAIAFLLSEVVDFGVYTPIRRRNIYLAVALSNTIGLVVDSAAFLFLAFGSLDFLAGQVVGKTWMTLLALALIAAYRQTRKTAEA